MRFVGLALILLTLPVFIAWLQSSARNRDHALTLLGLLVFVTGTISVDASFITWPMWNGTSRGAQISLGDMLAIALLFTRKRSATRLPFLGLLGTYLAVLTVSILYSRVPMASFFSVCDFGRGLLAFLAIAGELARPGAFSALLRGLALGLMVQAGYVISQKLSGVVQATGTLAHQNLLGMMAVLVVLPLLAAMLEGERHWLVKLGVLAGLIIVAGGGSRGAMAVLGGAAALLIVVSLIRRQTSQKLAIAGGATLMLLVAVPFAAMTLQDRFGGHSVLAQEDQRAAMEDAARAIAADNPFGVGANLYTNVSNLEGYSNRAGLAWHKANRSVPVHNAYLLARAETGYQGQVALILLLGLPMVVGLVHAFRHRRKRADGWVLGSVAALGAIAVQSTFEYSITVYTVQLPMILCIAIIAGRIRASRIERANPRPAAPPPRAGADDAMPALPRVPGSARSR
jgi:hypothetical protein